MIRHYNMHKKRDNSLQHGFMRFSPLDDCSVYYHGCHLNGKSTHYHCMQVPPAPAPASICRTGSGPPGSVPPTPRGRAAPRAGPPVDQEPWPSTGLASEPGGSWGLRLGQRLVGQGGAFPMAILGVDEIQ